MMMNTTMIVLALSLFNFFVSVIFPLLLFLIQFIFVIWDCLLYEERNQFELKNHLLKLQYK